jgi:hypothetical protein
LVLLIFLRQGLDFFSDLQVLGLTADVRGQLAVCSSGASRMQFEHVWALWKFEEWTWQNMISSCVLLDSHTAHVLHCFTALLPCFTSSCWSSHRQNLTAKNMSKLRYSVRQHEGLLREVLQGALLNSEEHTRHWHTLWYSLIICAYCIILGIPYWFIYCSKAIHKDSQIL